MSTYNIHFQYKIENHPKLTQICSYGIFVQGTQERVRNNRGKRTVSVRAIEALLYLILHNFLFTTFVNKELFLMYYYSVLVGSI